MTIKEYTINTSEEEKVREILSKFSKVRITGEDQDENSEFTKAEREEKKKNYRNLAGKAIELGEDIEELTNLSNREEAWREEDN